MTMCEKEERKSENFHSVYSEGNIKFEDIFHIFVVYKWVDKRNSRQRTKVRLESLIAVASGYSFG